MRNYLTFRNAPFLAAAGLVVALFPAGTAQAVTDTVFQYSTPKTGYVTFQAQNFTPRSSTTEFNSSAGNGLVPTAGAFFSTPLQLPQGAKITALTVWYQTQTTISIIRQRLTNNVADVPVNRTFNAGGGAFTIGNANMPSPPIVINNAQFSYSLQVFAEPGPAAFFNARITYTYTNAGD